MNYFGKWSRIFALALLLALTMVGAAYAAPNLPQAFYGNITAADGGTIDGGTVQATLAGEKFSISFTGAAYGSSDELGERLLVWGEDPSGKIAFSVNGISAAPSVTYVPGEITALNLTIPKGEANTNNGGNSGGRGGGGGSITEAGASASKVVKANTDTVVADSAKNFELVIPTGAIEIAAQVGAVITVKKTSGSEVAKFLKDLSTPQGFRSIGSAFEIRAETSTNQGTSDITTFNKPGTLSVKLSTEEVAMASDPEKVGFFKLNSDGTLTFVGGKYVDGQLVTPVHEPGQYIVAEVNIDFNDMNNHWSQKDVELMASKYVAKGYPGGKFIPNGEVTRAEFATMLVRALEIRGSQGALNFKDVNSTDWFGKELQTAVNFGVIKGFDDGTFRPNDLVSREQVAAMVARALKATGKAQVPTAEQLENIASTFSDYGKVNAWAKADLALAANASILKGKTASIIEPNAGATRAESAVMISRFWRK